MTTRTRTRPAWRVPTALVVWSAIPVVAGAARVAELTGGAPITADNARFLAAPVPILLHIVGATVYCVLGACQFVPGLRRGAWHRVAGRLLVLCGLVAALSGLWLAVFHPQPDGPLLTGFRVVFGATMAAAIVLAVAAIRRRDVTAHRAWMVRAYAVGLGAGTQAVVLGFWSGFAGEPSGLVRELLLGAGWVVNLAVAEGINLRENR